MIKFYELDDTDNLTGYHTYALDHKCIQSYKHLMHNSLGRSRRLSDTTVYTYSQYDPKHCMSISNEDSFNTCLKSCTSPQICKVYLENSITLVKDQYIDNDNMPSDVRIRPVSKYYTSASYENYITPTLEFSGVGVSFSALDVSGVNLSVHDIKLKEGVGYIFGTRSLNIQGGSHNFYNNYNKNSGALYGYDVSFIDVSMSFKNNYSNEGGAINAINSLTISGSNTNLHFIDNSAFIQGGAIAGGIKKFIINTQGNGQIIFSGNNVRPTLAAGIGGAIHSYNDLTIIDTNMIFRKNYASISGGAISVDGSLTISGNNNLHFWDNSSGLAGGAIWSKKYTNITDSSITFSNNHTYYNGGAIYSLLDISFIDSSITFSDNYSISGDGGAIFSGSDISVTDASITFNGNYCYNNGGAIYSKYTNITYSSVTFSDNHSILGYGGAITSPYDINFTDSSITFSNNYCNLGGGAINTNSITFIDASIIFSNNYSNDDGGAIYSYIGDISFIDSSITFIDNYSISGDGGAILHNSGEMIFAGGLYEFSNNYLLHQSHNGSAIGGDKILIDNSSQKTTLNFIDNSGKSTIWINNFDTSLACSDPSNKIPGCNNIYNFTHNLVNTGIFSFKDNLFMAGGSWDFSNNKIKDTSNTTAIYGYPTNSPTNKPTISIRYADISFDTTFITYSCSADVSNIGKTSSSTILQQYYNYSLYNTSEFSGQAAIEISDNRKNV